MKVICFHCQNELNLTEGQDIGRSEECPKCLSSLRCCKMCKFYDRNAYNECSEPMSERILEKEKANFCDFFKIGKANGQKSFQEDALARANALFKK